MNFKSILTIAGKDLRNIFLSPLFYILSSVCTLAWSFLFITQMSQYRTEQMMSMAQGGGSDWQSVHFRVFAPHFSLMNLFLIFAIAGLSVKFFAEEKRNRTFDLLLTAPVTSGEIALGKWVAGFVTGLALVTIGFLYPVSIAAFGHIEWGPLASSFIGIVLLATVYISIGSFTSSLTSNAVAATFLASVFSVLIWFVGAAVESSTDPTQRAVLEHLNIATHLQNFIQGSVTISGLVFLFSVITIFVFLTERVIESSRWR